MDNFKVENRYLCFSIDGRPVKVPLSFIRVLTPVYNIEETCCGRTADGDSRYTFDIWIYPTFAKTHGIHMRCIDATGYLYSTLPPTKDINKAHAMHAKLSELDGVSKTGL